MTGGGRVQVITLHKAGVMVSLKPGTHGTKGKAGASKPH